MINH
jgi:hypothetical protein